MKKYITIEYQDQVIDTRMFERANKMNEIVTIWKKRYAHLYFKAEIYITLQSKMNRLNYDY